jgi:hypothetical protein
VRLFVDDPAGDAVDRGVVIKVKTDARAEKAAPWRKRGRRDGGEKAVDEPIDNLITPS